jgi:hypothetical protein
MIRKSRCFVIATINVRSTKFELRAKLPKSMAPNQFAFSLDMEIDEAQWINRLPTKISLGRLVPPEARANLPIIPVVGASIPEVVMKRLTDK